MQIQYMEQIQRDRILLNPVRLEEMGFPKWLILSIGAWRQEVKVEASGELPMDAIGLSTRLFPSFHLPENLDYRSRWEDRQLHLGPVIAFFVLARTKGLTPERLEKHREYFADFEDIGGLVYLCAGDGVNREQKTIEGFCFSPGQPDTPWQKGVFPYPGAVYRKTGLAKGVYNDLVQEVGNRMFNTYFFNKWELWEYLSPMPEVRRYLPHTTKLTDIISLEDMMDAHGRVYLKKASGYKAKGIIRACKEEGEYHFQYRLKGTKKFDNPQDAEQFLREINAGRDAYLIQQAVDIQPVEGRSYDFRVIMQKDHSRHWSCTGMIARFGKVDSIATNFILEGYAMPGKDALKKVFRYNERQAFAKEQEIIHACIEVCEALDKTVGNYGDLGIDVMVDRNQRVWILEVNKLHDHRFPIYSIEDMQMYYRVVTTPLAYAKALAGY